MNFTRRQKKARVKSRAKTANEDNSFFDFPRAELYRSFLALYVLSSVNVFIAAFSYLKKSECSSHSKT